MKLLLQNRQSAMRLRAAGVRKLATWLVAQWPALKPLTAWAEIALIFTDDDGWTLRSIDGSRGAHSEHTVAITPDGPLVLTARD